MCIRDRGIGIELCPISNLQTKAVASADEYPIREFLDAGLKVTINTDNRTVSNTTLSKELEFIEKTYGIQMCIRDRMYMVLEQILLPTMRY